MKVKNVEVELQPHPVRFVVLIILGKNPISGLTQNGRDEPRRYEKNGVGTGLVRMNVRMHSYERTYPYPNVDFLKG